MTYANFQAIILVHIHLIFTSFHALIQAISLYMIM